MPTRSVFLITGPPGSGKTTLIRQVISMLRLNAGGFYTEEIRQDGKRQGFQIVTLNGERGILASVSYHSQYRVSKYGVNVDNLNNTGVAALRRAVADKDVIVIDEIGKMELYSDNFKQAVMEAIHSGKAVLGTIMLAPHPWADKIKALRNVHVVHLTPGNRNEVQRQLTDWLKEFLKL